MASITDKLKRYCCGSGALAWLLTVTVFGSLLLWLIGAICRLTGIGDAWITEWLALSADPVTALTRPWTFASYIITHLSPLHLIFNTLWLYWFGIMMSDTGRDRAIVNLFVGGGVAGGIIYVLSSWLSGYSSQAVLTGDSAAVLSVMTAVALLMPNRSLRLFLLGEIKLKWIAGVCILITLVGANGTGMPPQLAHWAGVAFGVGYALYCKGIFRRNRSNSGQKRFNVKATMKAMEKHISDEDRLDALLDKIRMSGYDSLSSREKSELNHISSRIEK